ATIMLGSCARAQQATVKFWDPGLFAVSADGILNKDRSFIYKAVAAYQAANSGETIEITETSGDITATSNQFRAASIAKNGPDMKSAYAGGAVLSFSQFIEPLDSVFSPEEQARITGWDTVRDGYRTDGSILALPYGAGSYFYVFYRPSLFQQAGVEFVEPRTWEDMLALGEELKAKGVTPFWVCNQEGYMGAWAIAALGGGQLGANAFTEMVLKNQPINSPGLVEAYKAYADMYARGLTNPDAGELQNGEATSGFVQGRGAMTINGAWSNAELLDALGDDVGMFPIPTLASAREPGVLAGGPNLAVFVTNYAANKGAAFKFIKYLAEAKTIDLYVELSQTEPSNHKDADASVITNRLLREQAERLKTTKTVYPFDNIMPQPVIDLFYRVNATTFTGQQTAEDAVAQLQAEFDKQG
ncbi:ABC transporter substrate-binding protein, partial [Devosia sp.]|uniref:ABC transporter substrate-binding protein n=1 Tax=Devosia sp. TaxID=1871048 RepID=UPI001AC8943E